MALGCIATGLSVPGTMALLDARTGAGQQHVLDRCPCLLTYSKNRHEPVRASGILKIPHTAPPAPRGWKHAGPGQRALIVTAQTGREHKGYLLGRSDLGNVPIDPKREPNRPSTRRQLVAHYGLCGWGRNATGFSYWLAYQPERNVTLNGGGFSPLTSPRCRKPRDS